MTKEELRFQLIETTIESLLTSYAYNRTFKYMIELCEELEDRVLGCYRHTDDGDIIYGFLILMFGEYGTLPRSGWLDNENIGPILKCLNNLIEVYKRLEMEEWNN